MEIISFTTARNGRKPGRSCRTRERVAWRPFPILDGGQDNAEEVAVLGQEFFNTFDMKTQKEEKLWTFYINQRIGLCDGRTHTVGLTRQL